LFPYPRVIDINVTKAIPTALAITHGIPLLFTKAGWNIAQFPYNSNLIPELHPKETYHILDCDELNVYSLVIISAVLAGLLPPFLPTIASHKVYLIVTIAQTYQSLSCDKLQISRGY
jgi:hypothetical protein